MSRKEGGGRRRRNETVRMWTRGKRLKQHPLPSLRLEKRFFRQPFGGLSVKAKTKERRKEKKKSPAWKRKKKEKRGEEEASQLRSSMLFIGPAVAFQKHPLFAPASAYLHPWLPISRKKKRRGGNYSPEGKKGREGGGRKKAACEEHRERILCRVVIYRFSYAASYRDLWEKEEGKVKKVCEGKGGAEKEGRRNWLRPNLFSLLAFALWTAANFYWEYLEEFE